MDYMINRFGSAIASAVVYDFDRDLKLEVSLNEHMGSQIFWYGSYNRDILRVLSRLLKPGMVFLDVGANIGEVSVFSAKRVTEAGKVLAIEPVSAIAARLQRNLDMNGYTQANVIRFGVADYKGAADIFLPESEGCQAQYNAGLATLYPPAAADGKRERIEITTLDDIVSDYGLDRLDIIKIDIEGGELPALRGARKLLDRFHPWIIIEVKLENKSSHAEAEESVLSYLSEFGYHFEIIGRNGACRPVSMDALGEFQNVLCVPGGRQSYG